MRQALPLTFAFASWLAPTSLAFANGRVSTFEVQPDGTGTVRIYDDVTGALVGTPSELQGLTLLPLEANARTHVLEFQPGAARVRNDVPAATRVLLPGRRGSLFHYRRTDALGEQLFGFFVVPPRGAAMFVHELPGIGAGQLGDPFIARVACSPAGDAFLVATQPPAGGNVLEVRLTAPAQVVDRTANMPPRRFFPQSLLLSDTWGTLGMKRALFRFDRHPGAQAVPLSYGALPVPSQVTGAVVLSRNGLFAAATAGAGPSNLDVYVFGPTGPAALGTPNPAALSGAGYLPEADDGPHLAVADDGLTCAWRTEGVSRECWVGRVQAPPTDPATELSGNSRFLDTLDEVGVFVFRGPTRLQVGVGAQVAPGVSNLENTDLFQVDVPSTLGSAQFLNLSLSSGDPSLPFLAVPSITLERIALVPGGDTWYADGNSHTGNLSVAREGQTGSTVLLPSMKTFGDWEFVAGYAWLQVRSDSGSRPFEVYRAPIDLASPPVLVASDDTADFSRHAVRNDGVVACIATNPGVSTLFTTNLATGASQTFAGATSSFGPTLTFTPTGALAFTTTAAGGAPLFLTWTPGGATVPLQVSGAVGGFILPIGP